MTKVTNRPRSNAKPEQLELGRSGSALRVALGNSHGAAVTADGALYTWGGNEFGECGRTEAESVPVGLVMFSVAVRVVSVSCGFFHTAVAADDGSVWTFGWGRWGQLGHGESSTQPVRVDQLRQRQIGSVACGHHSTLALERDGQVWAWGWWRGAPPASHEEHREQVSMAADRLALPAPASAVQAGGTHGAAQLVDGSLWTWGSASYGQLGLGDTVDRPVPTHVPSLHSVRGAGCGEEHTAAIGAVHDSTAELIWTWGRCEYGRGHACHLTPQLLPSPAGRLPLSIACGFHHSACLLSSGEVLCWSAHALVGS